MEIGFVEVSPLNYALKGNLSFNTVGLINKKVTQLFSGIKEASFNFEKINYCDSAGIASMIQWRKMARKKNIYLKFINVTSQMQNLINLYSNDWTFDENHSWFSSKIQT